MSSEPAIRAEGLSKAYLIYREPRDRLRQAVMPRVNRALRRLGLPRRDRAYCCEHWALRDISFEVARGETLAVIGRNGSGKSTLLQLVCGTLNPTTGSVATQGRVAALLELGSGFNPEYTGRENVLLNASVLGLTRAETLARIDDILAFADIGDFVDQPVKTYSSGMAMRLAFAVIAHVDAELLIVDEALAVGDAMFQQKCMRWLRAFQARGTLLFCGHDMGAVLALCERAIWLDRGELRMAGPAKQVAEAYGEFTAREVMGLGAAPPAPRPAAHAPLRAALQPTDGRDGFGSGRARITHVGLAEAEGAARPWFEGGEEVELTLRLEVQDALDEVILGFTLKDRLGQAVAGTNTLLVEPQPRISLAAGRALLASMRFTLPRLEPGDYALACAIASGTQASHVQHHWIHEAMVVSVRHGRAVGALVATPITRLRLEPGG